MNVSIRLAHSRTECQFYLDLTTCVDDAARASAAVKSELPGRGKQVKKEGEVYGEKVDAFFDKAVSVVPSKFFFQCRIAPISSRA